MSTVEVVNMQSKPMHILNRFCETTLYMYASECVTRLDHFSLTKQLIEVCGPDCYVVQSYQTECFNYDFLSSLKAVIETIASNLNNCWLYVYIE